MCCDTSYWVIICHTSLRYRSFATKRKIEFVKKSAGAEKGIEKSVPFLCPEKEKIEMEKKKSESNQDKWSQRQ